MMLLLLWGVWFVMNVIAFAMYGIDKHRAKMGAWRIPERTLLLQTWLLGGVGAYLAMRIFRHKTKHTAFVLSAPAAAVLSLVLMLLASLRLANFI